jgi:hypothetical protein
LIAFNHWLWMADSVSILSGFVITLFTRRFHIVCHATETRIANSSIRQGRFWVWQGRKFRQTLTLV